VGCLAVPDLCGFPQRPVGISQVWAAHCNQIGNIYEADHANSILMAGRADLVAVGRPHLADPYWTLREATKIGDRKAPDWPLPYLAGRDQAWRLADRDAEMMRA
ncbi:MAG: hypothetical protein AAFV87_18285, partial [Pseudomonadota bacterium]